MKLQAVVDFKNEEEMHRFVSLANDKGFAFQTKLSNAPGRPVSKGLKAQQFLKEMCSGKRIRKDLIVKMARKEGIVISTLNRERRKMGIVCGLSGGVWFWELLD